MADIEKKQNDPIVTGSDKQEANKEQQISVDNLRFLTTEQIDGIIDTLVSSNKQVFSTYFTLVKARELNKLSVKSDVTDKTDKPDGQS